MDGAQVRSRDLTIVFTMGREAIRMGGSMDVSSCGPCGYEDSAGSISIKIGANPIGRKDKGSSAMFISRGLVGPNPVRNSRLENRESG